VPWRLADSEKFDKGFTSEYSAGELQ